jgi:hypothetical protein
LTALGTIQMIRSSRFSFLQTSCWFRSITTNNHRIVIARKLDNMYDKNEERLCNDYRIGHAARRTISWFSLWL